MPIQKSFTEAHADFGSLCDQVTADLDIVIIARQDGEEVALISASELTSLLETVHLLRSPKNAERLLNALNKDFEKTEENKFIFIPESIEYLLMNLFGSRRYRGYSGKSEIRKWKKEICKVLKYISISVDLNIDSDQLHKTQLAEICKEFTDEVDEANTFNELQVILFEFFTKLTFCIIGGIPDHASLESPYKEAHWRLNKFRSLHFQQTNAQKARLLIDLIDFREDFEINTGKYSSLMEMISVEFGSDYDRFINWFKQNHPATYCEIF